MIACNSASAAMLRDARERYDVPVVEVIYPATRRAVAASHNGRIGVICTEATAESMAYDDAFAAAPHVELFTQPCPRFVDFVEAGVTGGDELLAVAHEYLDPLTEHGIDTLILGLHPLPAADRRDLLRDGRPGHAREQRGGVREGRLQDAGAHRPDARERRADLHLPHDRVCPAEFESIGRRFLGPEMVAASQFVGGLR